MESSAGPLKVFDGEQADARRADEMAFPFKGNARWEDSGMPRGRPRKPPVPTRSIGAAIPAADADRFAAMCNTLNVSQSDVLRHAAYEFMRTHQADYDAAIATQQEDRLPMTG